MIEQKSTVLYDLYDVLPPYGEGFINFYNEGLDVYIIVDYDVLDANSDFIKEGKLKITFTSVSDFRKTSFPGGSGIILCQNFNCIEEIHYSDLLENWQKYWNSNNMISRQRRHFQIVFTTENVHINVIAEDVNWNIE